MAEGQRVSEQWKPDDELTAERLEMMRVLAETAQLSAAGKNIRIYKSPLGGTAIAVDETPPGGKEFTGVFVITSAAQDGSNKRWTYDMTEQEKSAGGYAGWTVKAGGREIAAYNLMEEDNGATGSMGNGAFLDGGGFVAGTLYTLAEIPSGKGVHQVFIVTLTDGSQEYWFSACNGLSGSCE